MGEPAIRIAGHEDLHRGYRFNVFPAAEDPSVLARLLVLTNNGLPEPRGNCFAKNPLGFDGIEFEWIEDQTFPLAVNVRVFTDMFKDDANVVNPKWVTDHLPYSSEMVNRNYYIPIEFWVSGVRTVLQLTFHLAYSRHLSDEQKEELDHQAFRKVNSYHRDVERQPEPPKPTFWQSIHKFFGR